MNLAARILYTLFLFLPITACDRLDPQEQPQGPNLQLSSITIGETELDLNDFDDNQNLATNSPIAAVFSAALNNASVENAVKVVATDGTNIPLTIDFPDSKSFRATPNTPLDPNTVYNLSISSTLRGFEGESFPGISVEFVTNLDQLTITAFTVNGETKPSDGYITGIDLHSTIVQIDFSHPLSDESLQENKFILFGDGNSVETSADFSDDKKTVTITSLEKLSDLRRYYVTIVSTLEGEKGQPFEGETLSFFTTTDNESDFPVIPDDALLTLVQQQTFKYFYDFAHPASGMARERNSSGDLVTTGGTGFGVMALIVAMERNFITRQEGIEHFNKILTFLETADRFHGAWSHWVNGNTGKVLPFSTNDNGGDLVETSFLVQGLLTFRQYLDASVPQEIELINRINAVWQTVEWDWYTQGGQNVLYWHWSPDKGWIMNHQIRGYNEALITYVLAASSPTHSIEADVYHEGWANSGGIKNGRTFYDITLPLGFDYGGPLFFSHYSFLGLDPRNLSDTYGNYWTQNVNHSLINHAHAVVNPRKFAGYSEENWGFTASDNHEGYNAHSPTNDLGVISPTAALSSFPYTPDESMAAMKFFYYKLGDRLWGPHGFYDAFNVTEDWYANSYLAIDQGPIVVMIENHRTGLLWDLFMSAPEVQEGLTKLGFTY